MNYISMKSNGFGKDTLVEVQMHRDLPYNTAVSEPAGGEVVYCQGSQYRRLRRSEDCILNPKDSGMLGSKADPNEYKICFVDTNSSIEGRFGGNVAWEDPQCKNDISPIITTVKYNGKYAVKITDAALFMSSGVLLSGKECYTQKDLTDKVFDWLQNAVKSVISETVSKHSPSALDLHLMEMSSRVKENINADIEIKGLNMLSLQFVHCAPAADHQAMKNEGGIQIHAARVAKEKERILKGE